MPGSTIIGNEIFGPVKYEPDRNLEFQPGSLLCFKYMFLFVLGWEIATFKYESYSLKSNHFAGPRAHDIRH